MHGRGQDDVGGRESHQIPDKQTAMELMLVSQMIEPWGEAEGEDRPDTGEGADIGG